MIRDLIRIRRSSVPVCVLALLLESGASAAPFRARPSTVPQTEPGKTAIQERLNRVRTDLLSNAGRTDEAIRELKAILAIDPRSAEGHLLLGLAYRMQGSPEFMGEATAELRQALALSPGFVPARYYLAQLYLDLGRAARAREEMEAALVQVPKHPQFLALLGEAERQLGNARRSVDLNRQALQIDGSFAQARYYLALALFDLKQRDEAIRELEQVVRSGVEAVEAYLSLGSAYLDAGRLDEALQVLNEAIRLNPAKPDVRIQLARAYRSKGLVDKAEEQLKLATPEGLASLNAPFSEQLEFDFYTEQGLIRSQQGRLEDAAAIFRKLLDMDPSHGPTNRSLAEVYLLQGLYKRASEYAARAAKSGFPLAEDKQKVLRQKLQGKEASPRK